MAELKIKADSGGGSVSLKGPASSGATPSWRLPSADGSTGQFMKTDGSGVLSFATVDTSIADDSIIEAKLDIHAAPSGTNKFLGYTSNGMEWAVPPDTNTGKLLQMVGNSSNNNTVIATTTKSTTNMYQEITPSKTGSKLLFMCAGHYSQNPNGGSYGPQVIVSIYKKIGSGTDTEIHQVTYDYIGEVASVYYSHHFAATYFDPTATLNTTDVIRYTIYAKLLNANHQMRFNPSGYTSLVVQEYDA